MANLTRYALISADPFYRPDLLMVLASREGLRILPKESSDVAMPLSSDVGSPWSVADIENYVHTHLSPDTVIASAVNGEHGLWVSISIDGDEYWLMSNLTLINPSYGTTWIWWALASLVASILGATALTRRVIDPLNKLSAAARAFGRGTMPQNLPEERPAYAHHTSASRNRNG